MPPPRPTPPPLVIFLGIPANILFGTETLSYGILWRAEAKYSENEYFAF